MSAMRVPSMGCLRALRCINNIERAPLAHRSYATSTVKLNLDPTREERKSGPLPLDQPLGVPYPPRAGENTGVDTRSAKQRRDDFMDHEKHLEKRKKLSKELFHRSYFADFIDMKHFGGKIFYAPERVLKAQFARYFPNLRGMTLEDKEADTTNVLQGKISIVSVASSTWAQQQADAWCSEQHNTGLAGLVDHNPKARGRKAQLIEINYEPNKLKYWLIRLLANQQRKIRSKFRWGRVFQVHKGFEEDLRLAIGMPNTKVGQVYLVDERCKIRWAGHAQPEEFEKASMIRNLQRLLTEPTLAPEEKRVVAEGERTPEAPSAQKEVA